MPIPESWLVGMLKILPKKGNLQLMKNYRGIMVLEASYKVMANIILERLNVIADILPQESQCGFRLA